MHAQLSSWAIFLFFFFGGGGGGGGGGGLSLYPSPYFVYVSSYGAGETALCAGTPDF